MFTLHNLIQINFLKILEGVKMFSTALDKCLGGVHSQIQSFLGSFFIISCQIVEHFMCNSQIRPQMCMVLANKLHSLIINNVSGETMKVENFLKNMFANYAAE